MLYSFNRSAIVVLTLASCLTVSAQCDPLEVDFGEEPWGLAPDGVETFIDPAEISVPYTDDVHLLVPSMASEVVPETPLDAPIDSVVISAAFVGCIWRSLRRRGGSPAIGGTGTMSSFSRPMTSTTRTRLYLNGVQK